jgi:replicative DNA helicase
MRQIEVAEAALFRVAEGASGGSEAESFRGATSKALEMIETAINSGGHVSGKTTGFTSINDKCGGLHNSDLIILAGRPGMGKTSLATNIAFNCADRLLRDQRDGIGKSVGAGVAFFSLEMSSDQLATRVLAEQAGIPSEALRMGKISREDFQQLSYASQRLAELPLFIDDTPALTIAALRTRARRLKRKHDIGLIVVDYLQLLQGSGRSQDNRVNEISEISRGLKTLAKELQVPVIALSQLSRAVESREDKRPLLSDLRESGSIEQDADVVMFVYRDDYYQERAEPKQRPDESLERFQERYNGWFQRFQDVKNKADVIIAKQRNGPIGTVQLQFDPSYGRFRNPEFADYGDRLS